MSSGSADKTLKLWDLKEGNVIKTFEHPGEVKSLIYIKELCYLASGCRDPCDLFDDSIYCPIKIWDFKEGKLIKDSVTALTYIKESFCLASGSAFPLVLVYYRHDDSI